MARKSSTKKFLDCKFSSLKKGTICATLVPIGRWFAAGRTASRNCVGTILVGNCGSILKGSYVPTVSALQEERHSGLEKALARATLRRAPEFEARHLAISAWAFAQLKRWDLKSHNADRISGTQSSFSVQ
eukprot:3854468-Amphidinium_carterae.1